MTLFSLPSLLDDFSFVFFTVSQTELFWFVKHRLTAHVICINFLAAFYMFAVLNLKIVRDSHLTTFFEYSEYTPRFMSQRKQKTLAPNRMSVY